MAIHANSTVTPARPLLSEALPSGGLLQARRAELLAILDAGPLPHAFMTRHQRETMLAGVDALIDYLDAVAPDADLEDDETEDEADLEPSLGAPEVEFSEFTGRIVRRGHIDQRLWNDGLVVSPEFVDVEADEADLEASLGAPERHPGPWGYGFDLHTNQARWADGGDQDREEQNEDGGDINDERHDHFEEGDDADLEPSLGSLDGQISQIAWSRGLGSEEGDYDEVRGPQADSLDRRGRRKAAHIQANALLDRHRLRHPGNLGALIPVGPVTLCAGPV